MLNYYFVCHAKLWYFAHNLQMEQESDLVALGKLTHEEHYTRDTSKEEFKLAGIKLDRITPDGYVHEIKKSDKAEKAHIWQLKFYLWVLKENGFGTLKGALEFPKQRKRVEVTSTEADDAADRPLDTVDNGNRQSSGAAETGEDSVLQAVLLSGAVLVLV